MLPKEKQSSIFLSLSSKFKQAPEEKTETSLGEEMPQWSSSAQAVQSNQSRDIIPLALSCLLSARWEFICFCTLELWACTCLCGDSTKLGKAASPDIEGGEGCLHGFFFSPHPVLAGV